MLRNIKERIEAPKTMIRRGNQPIPTLEERKREIDKSGRRRRLYLEMRCPTSDNMLTLSPPVVALIASKIGCFCV